MKILKKLISLCLILFCLFTNILPILAAEDGNETPQVTFENEGNAEPDLYITKVVEPLDSSYPIPEELLLTEFTFVLKLNDKLVNTVRYRVFNEKGEEVFLYEEGEDTEDRSNKIPFETDRSGTFSLKAGQTAKFEYVGAGKAYEVSEIPSEGFEQTVPAAGLPATGTIPAEGTGVQFTNTYIPEETGVGTTTIQVKKVVSYPSGYELPETPDFSFTLELKGKPHAGEGYTIIDTDAGTTVGNGRTDQDGRFTIKGGQTAIFEEIPAGADYKVTEEEIEGWRIIGEKVVEGATKKPFTMVNYTNANASFAVSKTMNDNSKPEVNFSFVLTDESKKVMKDIPYHLYYTDGKLVDDLVRQTDESGKFILMPGQTAIFSGIAPGTIYNVQEEVHENFKQNIPAAATGYTNKTVSDAVEVLPFVNEERDTSVKVLAVTKKVTVIGEDTPKPDQSFRFKLLQKEGDNYVPVSGGAVYLIDEGTSQKSYKTDEEGIFTLKENETARFEELKSGGTYKVEEIDIPRGYYIDENVKEGTLQDNLYFSFTNEYGGEALKMDLTILKKNDANESLSGAIFALYADEELTTQIGEDITDTEELPGIIQALDLNVGTYYLVEKQAPKGYQLLSAPIVIEIFELDDRTAVKVNGEQYTTTDSNEPIYITPQNGKNDEITVTIYNKKGFTLPVTGAGGVWFIVAAGLLGIAIIVVLLRRYKMKQIK